MGFPSANARPRFKMTSPSPRRVHFAEQIEYSPPSNLPALSPTSPRSFSDTHRSTPSPILITPPPALHNFNELPLPPSQPTTPPREETLHPLLQASQTPEIRWNLLDHVSTALSRLTPEERKAPAVWPPAERLTITSRSFPIPWFMTVLPSSSSSSSPPSPPGAFVTVEDVLLEVALSAGLTVLGVELDDADKKRTAGAFEARCRRWALDPRKSRRIRLDYLEGRTLLAGFTFDGRGVLRLRVLPAQH